MSNHTASWAYVGLDVHADTITVAVAEGIGRGRGRNVGTIPNRPDSIRKAMKKLGRAKSLRVCYEAGPTGYAPSRETRRFSRLIVSTSGGGNTE